MVRVLKIPLAVYIGTILLCNMCFHPNFRYNGKNDVILNNLNVQQFVGNYDSYISFTEKLKRDNVPFKESDFQVIGCGQCLDCRLSKAREWAFRCVVESKQFAFNYFVTLSYDDDHIPLDKIFSRDTGELVRSSYFNRDKHETVYFDGFASLCPDHLSKFMKDLRSYYSYHYDHTGIRFFACGEYGDLSHRPHYHAIIFNFPIYDLKLLYVKDGCSFYTSDILNVIWNKGNVIVSDISFDTCAYVSGYVFKKINGKGVDDLNERFFKMDDSSSDRCVFTREFVRMSRKPGIGSEYYRSNKESIYKLDSVSCKKGDSVLTLKPPKYYDRLFDAEQPELLSNIKSERTQFAISRNSLVLDNTDLTFADYYRSKEINFKKKFSLKKDSF